MRKWVEISLAIMGLLVVTALVGFVLVAENPVPATPEAEAALISDS